MSKSHEAPLKKHLNGLLVDSPVGFTLCLVFAAFAVLLFATWVVFATLGPTTGKVTSGTELIAAYSGLLQGTLGSALSLGGTIATITLAVLAYRMVLLQERRERDGVAREFLTEGIQPIVDLSQALNRFLFVCVRLRQDWMAAESVDDWAGRHQDFCEAIEGVAACLERVSKSLTGNALMQFGESALRNGPEPGLLRKVRGAESLFTVNPLATWLQLLQERVGVFKNWSRQEALENFKLAFELTEQQLGKLRSCHAEDPLTRSALLFGGNLLWRVVSEDERLAMSLGCALLLDLVGAIPTQSEILEVLDEHFYPDEELPVRMQKLVGVISVASMLWTDLNMELKFFTSDQNWMVLTMELKPEGCPMPLSAEMG